MPTEVDLHQVFGLTCNISKVENVPTNEPTVVT